MTPSHIRRIVIVGGGSAGWMAAASLSRLVGRAASEVVLIESSAIGTVGVGEATLPTIRIFNQAQGIDEIDFMRRTNATFKLGIEFCDWQRPGHTFFHGFGDFGPSIEGVSPHQLWLATRDAGDEAGYENQSITSVAARLRAFAPPVPNPGSVLGSYSYAFHFDAGLYAAFLRGLAEHRGVTRIDANIVDVRLRPEDGFIQAVVLNDGREIEGDLFIDCSGFASLLLGKTLGIAFDDWSQYLPVNRAWAVPCERTATTTPFTRSTAREAGWQWRIPLQNRIGNGHVFCDAFMPETKAADILMANLDGQAQADPRLIRFTTGRRKTTWHKNCVALGLSSGFLEPLESTSIYMVEAGIGRLIELFPDRHFEPRLADEYNRQMSINQESIRDFIILHYCLSKREGPFWEHFRTLALPDTLRHQIDLFRTTGRVAINDAKSFAESSWVAIFLGQGLRPLRHDPLVELLDKAKVRRELDRRKGLIEGAARSLPPHDQFISRFVAAARAG